MSYKQTSLLILLAAIWGASFIFMHNVAPSLGPVATACLRILLAGFVLLIYYKFVGIRVEWKKSWKVFLFIGVVNSAIPFALYSFAALHLPASYSVVLNSTSPLFGAIYSAIWLSERFTFSKFFGTALGAVGVSFIVNLGPTEFRTMEFLSLIACLVAANCYALAGIYIKKKSSLFDSRTLAGGSQVLSGLAMLPLLSIFPFNYAPSSEVIYSLLSLSLLCSAVAYLLYFKLMNEIGPTKALTVTFLMPIFGVLWGKLFLNETITLSMIVGALLILVGTYFVVKTEKTFN